MMAAKRFKLKLCFLSFQLCRSSNQMISSSLPKSPTAMASTSLFSPIRPSTSLYPNTFPDPPPTTPKDCSNFSNNELIQSKTTCTQEICNSPDPVVYDSEGNAWPITPPKGHKKKMKKTPRKNKSSSIDSGWFSSQEYQESEKVFDSSFDQFAGMISTRKKNNAGNVKVRRLKSGGGESPVAVVKNSEAPYEDFKRSMMEMITEKQMFEVEDLEQLLHCFLSLNATHHHAVIVQAFSDIWETLPNY